MAALQSPNSFFFNTFEVRKANRALNGSLVLPLQFDLVWHEGHLPELLAGALRTLEVGNNDDRAFL